MAFRIGQYAFTPSTLVLPFALAFFLVVSYRRLYPRVMRAQLHAAALLVLSTICGVLGAWLHGYWAGGPHDTGLELRFGSCGGCWGALIAAALYATATRHSPARCADALVPGIVAGIVIARIGCLFTGCCQGIILDDSTFQPFRPWPAYDIAALLIAYACVRMAPAGIRRLGSPGAAVATFLIAYAMLRFSIEFLRDANAVTGTLTLNQWMMLAQCAAGLLLLSRMKEPRTSEL